ncbi:MAG: hypothetical protein OCD76_16515, partial [Reichenbachiella sp.]
MGLNNQGSKDQVRETTLSFMMPVIIISSLILLAGYGLMSFGSLKTVKYFGVLCSVTIISALYSQLIVFPYLLRRLGI